MERESGLILPPGVVLEEPSEGKRPVPVTRWGWLRLEVAGWGKPLMLFYREAKGHV